MVHRLLLALLLCAAVLGGVAPAWAHEHGETQVPTGHGTAHDHHHEKADDGAACTMPDAGYAGQDTAGCPGAASACGGLFTGWPAVAFDLRVREPAVLPEPGPGRHLTALVLSPDPRPPRASS